jgi:uncharacterized protein YndB with AHSA1/START domain
MGFPDRIERVLELPHPPARVWAALTTAEGLSGWFGNQATIDLRPGGSALMTWDGGDVARMRVERVEERSVFGFAQVPGEAHGTAYDGNTRGWASELGELVAYLDAA